MLVSEEHSFSFFFGQSILGHLPDDRQSKLISE
jgi:hypothetical protein